MGFEPTNNGFAIRPLSPLGYTALNWTGQDTPRATDILPNASAIGREKRIGSENDELALFGAVWDARRRAPHAGPLTAGGDSCISGYGRPESSQIRRRTDLAPDRG